jgi:hypothetical protein
LRNSGAARSLRRASLSASPQLIGFLGDFDHAEEADPAFGVYIDPRTHVGGEVQDVSAHSTRIHHPREEKRKNRFC